MHHCVNLITVLIPALKSQNYVAELRITCFKCSSQSRRRGHCERWVPRHRVWVCLYLLVRGCNPLVSIQLPFSYRDYANRHHAHSCFMGQDSHSVAPFIRTWSTQHVSPSIFYWIAPRWADVSFQFSPTNWAGCPTCKVTAVHSFILRQEKLNREMNSVFTFCSLFTSALIQ